MASGINPSVFSDIRGCILLDGLPIYWPLGIAETLSDLVTLHRTVFENTYFRSFTEWS